MALFTLTPIQKKMLPWIVGAVLLGILLVLGLLLPVSPYNPIPLFFLIVGSGFLGIVPVLAAVFLLPSLLASLSNTRENAGKAAIILKTVLKAALFAAAGIAFGYFVAPYLLAALAANVAALGFLSAMAGTGPIALVFLFLPAAISFISTIWKSPVKDMIAANPLRAAELFVGFSLCVFAGVAAFGLIPFAASIIIPVAVVTAIVGVCLAFGLASTAVEYYSSRPSQSREQGTEMSSLGSSPGLGPVPTPSSTNFSRQTPGGAVPQPQQNGGSFPPRSMQEPSAPPSLSRTS